MDLKNAQTSILDGALIKIPGLLFSLSGMDQRGHDHEKKLLFSLRRFNLRSTQWQRMALLQTKIQDPTPARGETTSRSGPRPRLVWNAWIRTTPKAKSTANATWHTRKNRSAEGALDSRSCRSKTYVSPEDSTLRSLITWLEINQWDLEVLMESSLPCHVH